MKRYLNGEAVASNARETQIPRSTLYQWILKARINPSKKMQIRDFSRLKMQYERSQRIVQILQTLLVPHHHLYRKNLKLLF